VQLRVPTLDDIRSARELIADAVAPSPLLRLADAHPSADIYLKLECLQPIGSFKLRGALNAIRQHDGARLMEGAVTASAGNMAQGLAWAGRQAGVRTTVVMPDSAPMTKRRAVERLGGRIVSVPFDRWWQVLRERRYPGLPGLFVSPVADQHMIEGNGTIGLEIAEQLPRIDAVLVPFGGGGLVSGIAAALQESHESASVLACEVETAAPLAASMAAGRPTTIQRCPSFVDGIGTSEVLEEMWPLLEQLVAGTRVVSLPAIARAIRLLVDRQSVVAEGAGAASVAAALGDPTLEGVVVCVVSGGNIDADVLATILRGEMP
jgi:threonine dehydratase